MKIILSLFGLFLLLNFTTVMAQEKNNEPEEFLSGQELLDRCNEGASVGNPSQFCMHYVFGYVQNIEMLQSADPSQPRLFCIDPQVVSLPEVTEKMRNWLASVPGRLNQEAYILAGEALAKNYPCEATPF